jgi:hypothetical protein
VRLPVPSRALFSYVAALSFVALLWLGAPAAQAQAQGPSGYRVTFVARQVGVSGLPTPTGALQIW